MSCDDFYLTQRTMNIRVAEELRHAEARGLARLALSSQKGSDRFYCGALVWLGDRLVTWGLRLQERYSSSVSVRAPRSAGHSAS